MAVGWNGWAQTQITGAHNTINNATVTAFSENSALSAHQPYLHRDGKKTVLISFPLHLHPSLKTQKEKREREREIIFRESK